MGDQNPNPKLWVGNLSQKIDKDDLVALFREFGLISDIKILDKGIHVYAFVEFEKVDSAIEAHKNLSGHEVKGQPMKIEFATGRKRNNHRDRGDRDRDNKYRKRDNYKRRSRSRSHNHNKKKSKSHRRRSSSSSDRRHKSYKHKKTNFRSPKDSVSMSKS